MIFYAIGEQSSDVDAVTTSVEDARVWMEQHEGVGEEVDDCIIMEWVEEYAQEILCDTDPWGYVYVRVLQWIAGTEGPPDADRIVECKIEPDIYVHVAGTVEARSHG